MTWTSTTMSTAISSLSVLSLLSSLVKGCSGNYISFQQVDQISSSSVFLLWLPFASSLAATSPQGSSHLSTHSYPSFSFTFSLQFMPLALPGVCSLPNWNLPSLLIFFVALMPPSTYIIISCWQQYMMLVFLLFKHSLFLQSPLMIIICVIKLNILHNVFLNSICNILKWKAF